MHRFASHLVLATASVLSVASAQSLDQHRTPAREPVSPGLQVSVSDLESNTPEANPIVEVHDLTGTLVHSWSSPLPGWAFAELAKPLSNGRLLALIYDRATAGSGKHKQLVELDWNGNVLWSFDAQTLLGYTLHHDFERLANGRTLVLAQDVLSIPALNPNPIRDDIILQVSPRGAVIGNWRMSDHVGGLNLTPAEVQHMQNFPGLVPKAIFHMNSVQALPPNPWEATDTRFRAGNLLVSLREMNRVFIIDSTSGAIVWLYQGALGQHHARMIPAGFPGYGNILIYDNGGTVGAPAQTRNYTRILEIDPVSKATVWSYEDQARPFYSEFMGACQRLPNGNTLITESLSGRIFEIRPNGQTVWESQHGAGKAYRTYRAPKRWQNAAFPFPW